MSSAIDLVVLNGPLEGEVIQLRPDLRIRLGRAKGGVQIPDLLVSMRHAEITFAGDQYWIEDVNSATGTFLDDERVLHKAHAMRPGMRVRLGETELEVRERPRSTGLRLAGALATVLLLVMGIRAFMDSVEVDYKPVIRWFEPIAFGAGLSSQDLEIPVSFIRQTGVDHRELSILRVSDHDGNGVDEVWLRLPGEERLVTFDFEGNWQTLAVLPPGCRERSAQDGFPDLDCHGTRWVYRNGVYEMAGMEGVVVWMSPVEEVVAPTSDDDDDAEAKPVKVKLTDGPPRAHLVSRVKPEQLAGFLAKRGVSEPVHYLVCEDALKGLRAQVRTASGEVVPLTLPCLRDVELGGVDVDRIFGEGIPRMVAFSAAGREALLRDFGLLIGGDPTGVAVSRTRRPIWDAIRQPPIVRRGAVRLKFEGDERLFKPIAPDVPLSDGPARLALTEQAPEPPSRMEVLRIDGPTFMEIPGCGALTVQSGPWHCLFAKGCGSTSTFLRISNEACGDGTPVDVPYARGDYPYDDGEVRGFVRVESIDAGRQIDVLRSRFIYEAEGR